MSTNTSLTVFPGTSIESCANNSSTVFGFFSTTCFAKFKTKVLYYIDEHLSSVLTLEVISRYMDVSKDHLNRTFKQDTGITIGQAIIKRRIEKQNSKEIPVKKIVRQKQCKVVPKINLEDLENE